MSWDEYYAKFNYRPLRPFYVNWKLWPKVDFLFSFHAIPFCDPNHFESVIKQAAASVLPNGIFAVTLFGPEDDWVKEGSTNGISKEDILELLQNFQIVELNDIQRIGGSINRPDKAWHEWEVIAQRKG